jgi:outer membrane protein assembly factor BamB
MRIGRTPLIAASLFVIFAGFAYSSTSSGSTSADPPPLVVMDARTGSIDHEFQVVECAPYSAVADGKTGWYVSGYSLIGPPGQSPPCLIHLLADGSADTTFAPKLSKYQYIDTLIRFKNVLYAGSGNGVAAFSARSGRRLWLRPTTDEVNRSLAMGNGVLYVTGFGRFGLAALDPRTGETKSLKTRLAWRKGFGASAGTVAFGNGVLYIAGNFDRVNGVKRPLGIAALNPRSGLPTPWSPQPGRQPSDVWSILATHGQILVGGKQGFAVYDSHSGHNLPWRDRLRGSATSFAVSGDTVYLAARTLYAGFDRVSYRRVNNLAAVRLPEGKFKNWRPFLAPCVDVGTIAVSGNKVLVGGDFEKTTPQCGGQG